MSVVTATILSDNEKIAEIYELLSIDIRREVNRIPFASLVFVDGDAAKRRFTMSDSKYFEPGKEIEIKLRYTSETSDATVFKGPVMRHGVEANVQGSLLRIEMKDPAVKLTRTRKSMVFREQSDSEVIGRLIQGAGLKSEKIEDTQPKHAEIVQYYCSDWDFILSRADIQGLIAVADDGDISLRKIDLSAPRKHTFDFGISEIFDFEFEVDAGNQHSTVNSRGWDVGEQQSTAPVEAKTFSLSQGNLDGAALAKAVGFDICRLSHPVPLAQEELKAWADARMMRMRMSMIRGRLSTKGVPGIKLLDVIELAHFGARFNGKTLVTGIRHRIDTDGWRTDIQFGLSARSFSREEGIQDTPAAGLLPGVGGLQIGIVESSDDPDKQARVKVMLPGIDAEDRSVWARLAAPDAGNGRGHFFRPEVEDEVVVGFFNEDPRQPVILGALYNAKNQPPKDFEITEKNLKKGIVTKAGSKIVFNDDENASLIEISDRHGNKITLDENGIKIDSIKDLTLTASGKVDVK